MRTYPHSDWKNKDRYFLKPWLRRELDEAKRVSFGCYLNRVRLLNNCPAARRERGQVTIKQILLRAWPDFKERHWAQLGRPGLVEQVEASIMCGDFDTGFEVFECAKCGERMIVPHTCKSRFCAKCGKKYRDARSAEVARKLLDVPHRQFVFSVPFELRSLFQRYRRPCLDALFRTVEQVFETMLRQDAPEAYRKEGRRPGMVLFLHTFGRDMKWHPHIHALVAERYLRKDGTLGKWSYFAYGRVRKTFMYQLLANVGRAIPEDERHSYRRLSRKITAKFREGFYIHGPQIEGTTVQGMRQLARYVARYAGHPAISESRIDRFDPDGMLVTWHYEPHEDDAREEGEKIGTRTVTESADEFIKRLLIHVPDPGFQQIRYYGFYSNRTDAEANIGKMCTEKEIAAMTEMLRWRKMLRNAYGFDPLWCHCGGIMEKDMAGSYIPTASDMLEYRHELGFI